MPISRKQWQCCAIKTWKKRHWCNESSELCGDLKKRRSQSRWRRQLGNTTASIVLPLLCGCTYPEIVSPRVYIFGGSCQNLAQRHENKTPLGSRLAALLCRNGDTEIRDVSEKCARAGTAALPPCSSQGGVKKRCEERCRANGVKWDASWHPSADCFLLVPWTFKIRFSSRSPIPLWILKLPRNSSSLWYTLHLLWCEGKLHKTGTG